MAALGAEAVTDADGAFVGESACVVVTALAITLSAMPVDVGVDACSAGATGAVVSVAGAGVTVSGCACPQAAMSQATDKKIKTSNELCFVKVFKLISPKAHL